MKSIFEKINNSLTNNESIINEKTFGIHFLEKLKYILLEELSKIDKSEIENLITDIQKNNFHSDKFCFNIIPLDSNISFYKDAVSKIKSTYNQDTLSIILDGFKVISIFDFNDNKTSKALHISKNMGIVLSKETITSEKIGSDSLILDFVIKKVALDIENI